MNDKPLALIIFDCDGTLVDSEHLTHQVLVNKLNDLGINADLNLLINKFTGKKMLEIISFIEETSNIKLPDDFIPLFRQSMKLVFNSELQSFPGVTDIIPKIKNKICVASNGPH